VAKKKVSPVHSSDLRRMEMIIQTLEREYPEAQCSLYFKTPYQLLIATMLSAQCTDERVNQVTPYLKSCTLFVQSIFTRIRQRPY